MSDYVSDSKTSFVASGRVSYGFDWIRDRYAPRIDRGAARDSLHFEEVAALRLGSHSALATARFVLSQGDFGDREWAVHAGATTRTRQLENHT